MSTLICGGILKFPNGTSRTTYNGAKVVLWANATLPSSVDWFGLGKYNSEIYFNTGVSCKHSFQVAGTEYAYIDSNNIISSNLSTTNIHLIIK